jgi:hypothetical protein
MQTYRENVLKIKCVSIFCIVFIQNMRTIQEVISCELLSKQETKNIYTKTAEILKLVLNIVTVRIEALVVSGSGVILTSSSGRRTGGSC